MSQPGFRRQPITRRPAAALTAALVLATASALPAAAAPTTAPRSASAPSAPAARSAKDAPAADDRGYEADGSPISGGSSFAGAPSVKPGRYLDSFTAGTDQGWGTMKETKHYRVTLKKGERLIVTGALVPTPSPKATPTTSDSVKSTIELTDGHGNDCAKWTSNGFSFPNIADAPQRATAVSTVVGTGEDGECEPGEFVAKVTREGNLKQSETMPMELVFAVEAPAPSPMPPEPEWDDEPAVPAPTAGSAKDDVTALGRSRNSAPILKPGSYVIELRPGETRIAGVDVNDGQRLSWSISPLDAGEVEGTWKQAEVMILNPLGQEVYDPDENASTTVNLDSSTGDYLGSAMPTPVTLGNQRTDADKEQASNWLGGTHTLQLSTKADASDEPDTTKPRRVVLTLAVDGTAGENADVDYGKTRAEQEQAVSRATWLRRGLFVGAGVLGLVAVGSGIAAITALRRRS